MVGRIAFLSDIHFPEHHRQAWPLTLKILPALNLDLIYGAGDWFEMEQLSSFDVMPDRAMMLKEDIALSIKELVRLRKAMPNIPIKFKLGNHEWRYYKTLIKKVPQLFGVKGHSLPEMFEFERFDIEWIPPHRRIEIGKLLFIHGDEVMKSAGVYPARNLYMKVNCNAICGHWHYESQYIHPMSGRDKLEGAWTNSCLRTLHPDWAPFSRWTLGFSIIDFSAGGFFHVDQVLMHKRDSKLWCTIGGKEYSV